MRKKERKKKETSSQRTEGWRKLQEQEEEIKFGNHREVTLASLVSVPRS
jgi:hypothetical protein